MYSLVFWWWWARWYSHIWVINYLLENNIAISDITWTSVWSIIWVLFSLWVDTTNIKKCLEEMSLFKILDRKWKNWLINGDKVISVVKKYSWDLWFNDLPIPIQIVATNLKTGDMVTFKKWSILKAIRASIGIPWVFSPFIHEDWVFIDGGLTSNLPVDIALTKKIIASSVCKDTSAYEYKAKDEDAWFFKIPHRNLFQMSNLLVHSFDILLVTAENRDLILKEKKDWSKIFLIRPKLEEEFWEDSKSDKLIKRGYDEASLTLGEKYNIWSLY